VDLRDEQRELQRTSFVMELWHARDLPGAPPQSPGGPEAGGFR
jgi:hypothetical protein